MPKRRHPRLYNIVFGESVLNDAVAIVLFNVFNELRQDRNNDGWAATGSVIGSVLLITVVSILIGVSIGALSAFIFKYVNNDNQHDSAELAFMILLAYTAYVIPEVASFLSTLAILPLFNVEIFVVFC